MNEPDVQEPARPGRKHKDIHGLIVPADLFLELVRVYKQAPPGAITRKHWLEAHRLEAIAQGKLYRSRMENKK